jgi:hypothetical protein
MRRLGWLLGLALLAGRPAFAQQFLYEPSPPAGSAFLRFVNGLGAEATVTSGFLPAQRLGTTPEQRAGAYQVVERVAGRSLPIEIAAAGATARATLTAAPGSFVTVLLLPTAASGIEATAITDLTEFNQLRARLSFYNAAPGCAGATLTLLPAGQAVFADVPRNASRSRSVNPVSAQLRASCGEATAPEFALAGIEAGGMYSIWLMRPAGSPIAFMTRDTTARRR